jgi:hypothetical protein
MGSSSKSSSQSSSTETTDSYNTTLTNSITGAGGLGINTGDISGGLSDLSYAYDSNNPVTNNNQTYALGAGANASPTNSGTGGDTPSTTSTDWSEIVVYVIAGIVLVLVLRLFGDKNS